MAMTLVILDKSSAQIVCGTPLTTAKNAIAATERQITKWERNVECRISTVLPWRSDRDQPEFKALGANNPRRRRHEARQRWSGRLRPRIRSSGRQEQPLASAPSPP